MELVAIIKLNDTEVIKNNVIVIHNVVGLKREAEYIVIETETFYNRFKVTDIREFQLTEEFFYRIREDK